ncbi:MAG: hypothetical protein MI861_04000 [Pirellulales bacterium]|nr:hypothetical protein [Pirellulales bacterium]
MTNGYQDIPSLLHDAKLILLDWEQELRSLRLYFTCLMRNVDGSSIPEPVVELQLSGVERIAAYYSPASVEVRPSEFHNPSPFSAADLIAWNREPCEAYLSINSAQADFKMATSCQLTWPFGSPSDANKSEVSLGVHLALEEHSYGRDVVATGLYFGCDALRPMMSSVPLSVDDWRQQFDAWWKSWHDHWDLQDSDEPRGERQPVLEDTFIPAGTDRPPDLSYRPPSEPAFRLETADAPAELLLPINDFHSGLLEHDWERMARAYPNFDKGNADRAQELSHLYLSHEFGRWVYVRQVDSWWAEDVRACVVVRGIEHAMPNEEDPAMNHETVITYGLLKSEDRWIISTWSQGWPQYGSAPKSRGRSSWRDGWNLEA